MEQQGFRRSLFGFRKKDVLRYIQELNAEFAERIAEKDAEIESLRAKQSRNGEKTE